MPARLRWPTRMHGSNDSLAVSEPRSRRWHELLAAVERMTRMAERLSLSESAGSGSSSYGLPLRGCEHSIRGPALVGGGAGEDKACPCGGRGAGLDKDCLCVMVGRGASGYGGARGLLLRAAFCAGLCVG